jgi:NNP family nitrate/nitrite transporter-like MFS transporter
VASFDSSAKRADICESFVDGRSFHDALPAVAFLTTLFLANFTARIILSPLMVPIEDDLGITHTHAGQLFLVIGLGVSLSMLSSGFVANRLGHRKTIAGSSLVMGTGLLASAAVTGYTPLLATLFLVGVGSGLYLPSGIATITMLTRQRDWGKSLAVHELAPNTSFLLGPLLAELVLWLAGWRTALTVLGLAHLCLGVAYLWRGVRCAMTTEPPSFSLFKRIAKRRGFWLLILFFSVAVGASIGPYSVLPLYLVDDHGFTRPEANQLLAASRVFCIAVAFAAGFLVDRFGVKRMLGTYFLLCGLATLGLALPGKYVIAAVLLQPVLTVLYFAAGFTSLAMLFDASIRNVAVGFISPTAAFVGTGIVPAVLGRLGDAGEFELGFAGLGLLLFCCLGLLPLLHFRKS